MVSSSIAQFVSYPLALVRTRLQVRARAHVSLSLSLCLPLCVVSAREGWRMCCGLACLSAPQHASLLAWPWPCSSNTTPSRTPHTLHTPQAQGVKGIPIKYSGMADVFRQTYRNEGVRGFYKVRCVCVCGSGGGGDTCNT
jgi:hypothetical protein